MVDLLSYVVGRRIAAVSAETRTIIKRRTVTEETDPQRFEANAHTVTADDHVHATVRFGGSGSEIEGQLLLSSVMTGEPKFIVEVFGTKGRLSFVKDTLTIERHRQKPEQLIVESFAEKPLDNAWSYGTFLMAQQLRLHVSEGAAASTISQRAAKFEDGDYVQRVLDAMRKSSEQRQWVQLLQRQ
jgi:predicted dehydrogenase